jgi:hypothetical protein
LVVKVISGQEFLKEKKGARSEHRRIQSKTMKTFPIVILGEGVDGRWSEDPGASQRVANPYGDFNSVLVVPLAVRMSIL